MTGSSLITTKCLHNLGRVSRNNNASCTYHPPRTLLLTRLHLSLVSVPSHTRPTHLLAICMNVNLASLRFSAIFTMSGAVYIIPLSRDGILGGMILMIYWNQNIPGITAVHAAVSAYLPFLQAALEVFVRTSRISTKEYCCCFKNAYSFIMKLMQLRWIMNCILFPCIKIIPPVI